MSAQLTAAVEQEVIVPVDPETAFRLYVSRPGRTHPSEGQSGDPAEIVYEPFVGGRWFERDHAGGEYDWGRILVWDPPRRLGLAWMVNAHTGVWAYDPDPAHASRADITFEPVTAGTRVRVRHTGFEQHGPSAARIRHGAENGWAADLRDLARAARAALDGAQPLNTIAQLQVNLFCENVENCLGFYGRLGLPEAFRFPATGPIEHVEVEAAGIRIGLTSAAAANKIAALGVAPSGGVTTEIVLWSDNTDALFDCAVSAGATVITAPMDSPDGRLRYAWVRDPDGHQVKFVQDR